MMLSIQQCSIWLVSRMIAKEGACCSAAGADVTVARRSSLVQLVEST
jgi:hypothetical protein